jgi:hypothetical protein
MKGSWWLTVGLTILGTLAGCKSTVPPDLSHPGRADVQQKRALRYDPYPETGVVGASMDGTRPRDYEAPPAEISRGRWVRPERAQYPNTERWNTDGLK